MSLNILVIAPVHADPEFRRKMIALRKICERFGGDCVVPAVEPKPFDLDSAVKAMRGADLILADLSFGRPSCYYELGVAEAAGGRVALLAEAGTEIFQHSGRRDVNNYAGLADYEALVTRLIGLLA